MLAYDSFVFRKELLDGLALCYSVCREDRCAGPRFHMRAAGRSRLFEIGIKHVREHQGYSSM